jgi:hypothetical protein
MSDPSLPIYQGKIINASDLTVALQWVEQQGFIPAISSGPHSVGTTLETMLNHELDALPLKDWEDTEMKAQRNKTQSPTTLFTKEPYWAKGWNSKRLLIENGYPDNDGHPYALRINLYTREFHGLHLDSTTDGMQLIQTKTGELIGHWDTNSMEKGFEKIRDITYITADSKKNGGKEFFHYNTFKRFRLKENLSAVDIMREIESGALDLELRMYMCADHEHCRKYGRSEGQVRNHGTAFRCSPRKLSQVFDITDLMGA